MALSVAADSATDLDWRFAIYNQYRRVTAAAYAMTLTRASLLAAVLLSGCSTLRVVREAVKSVQADVHSLSEHTKTVTTLPDWLIPTVMGCVIAAAAALVGFCVLYALHAKNHRRIQELHQRKAKTLLDGK